MTDVMIGVDPHKRSHTATMIDRGQRELRRITVRAGRRQVVELLEWADGATPRTWAVECAGGMGYLLAQQLVAAGEFVLDVPATLASRLRVLGTGQSTKTGANDGACKAASATERASLGSFLVDWPVLSTRTCDANVAGTLSTVSPAATSCWESR